MLNILAIATKGRLICAAGFLYLLGATTSSAENKRISEAGIEFSQVDINLGTELENDIHQQFFAYAGDESKPGVLFIHGTPGGWGAFAAYLENPGLQRDFFMVSVDRLGWGKSPLPAKQIDGDFKPQSLGIGGVFNKYPGKKWTLVGHSLGASIAPQIALDYPDRVSGLLLLAGSLKPSLGSPRWYNRIASTWLVANLIGKGMKYSNREIMGLRKQLEAMDEKLRTAKLETKLIIMQGKKDRLVSPKNPAYAVKEWQDSFISIESVELEKAGHFLPWRQENLVEKLIYDLARIE